MTYCWKTVSIEEFRFLSPLAQVFTDNEVELFQEQDLQGVSRTDYEGLITAIGWIDHKKVGFIYSDFRVNGACYGHRNSKRFAEFLKRLQSTGTPVIFAANTTGLSLMAGRKVFRDSFGIWPNILNFSKTNFLITIAMGKCLGLGPLLFAHGHYRMAVQGETRLNLTGPEVLKLFFGNRFDFDEYSSAERQTKTTDLIHEMVDSREAAYAKARTIIRLLEPKFQLEKIPATSAPTHAVSKRDLPIHNMNLLLDQIGTQRIELFPQMNSLVRVFLIQRITGNIGVFINPPGNQNGMISVDTLQKYGAGLDLFNAMGIPVMSMLDAPGIDPRFDQTDRNIIRVMTWLGEKIIYYPHGHMGIAVGRVYGGATTLVFHRNFGGRKTLALKGTKMGSMHESLISKVLDGSPRLLKEWQEVACRQSADLKDLIETGNVDRIIDESEIGIEVDDFLLSLKAEKAIQSNSIGLLDGVPHSIYREPKLEIGA